MIDLHERLSEFSYGYGITREVEEALRSVGIRTAPFLPSLIDEANLGFDVKFEKPGGIVLLQFKLGQSLRRFVRKNGGVITPALDRPFWRFVVNTVEPEGQYETLLKAEQDGAETYYTAPQFVDWSEYLAAYEAGEVLDRSILVRPTWIRDALVAQGEPDGRHRIVYDQKRVYVCSEPKEIERLDPAHLGAAIRGSIAERKRKLSEVTRDVFSGLKRRGDIRRRFESSQPSAESDESEGVFETSSFMAVPHRDPNKARDVRVEKLRGRSKSEDDAFAAAIGIEAWSLGIQMILACLE